MTATVGQTWPIGEVPESSAYSSCHNTHCPVVSILDYKLIQLLRCQQLTSHVFHYLE